MQPARRRPRPPNCPRVSCARLPRGGRAEGPPSGRAAEEAVVERVEVELEDPRLEARGPDHVQGPLPAPHHAQPRSAAEQALRHAVQQGHRVQEGRQRVASVRQGARVRSDVDHRKGSARLQCAPRLPQGPRGVGEVMDHVEGRHQVEGTGGHGRPREVRGVAHAELGVGEPLLPGLGGRGLDGGGARVHADDAAAREGLGHETRGGALTTAHVQDPAPLRRLQRADNVVPQGGNELTYELCFMLLVSKLAHPRPEGAVVRLRHSLALSGVPDNLVKCASYQQRQLLEVEQEAVQSILAVRGH
mmetsp:Transcript_90231/g.269210  ORF Transcript_90231/g.269210 Transcript_90231/m.269210 type:complete len:303 (+) Transcript_90231:151-1059(+)